MTLARAAWPLLSLSLLLTACTSTPAPPTAICAQSVGALAAGPVASVADGIAAARPGAPDWRGEHVPGEVLVISGRAGLSAQGLSALSGVRTQAVLSSLQVAYTPAGETDRAFAARLAAAGLRVQPNFVYRALATPNDPGFPGNGGVQLSTPAGNRQLTQPYLNRIRAPQAWAFLAGCGKTPVGAKTAVVDSALDTGHPELNKRVVATASFLTSAAGSSTKEHGTAAAGGVGVVTNNDEGLAGVTWTGPLVGVEVLGSAGTTTAILTRGLDYAVKQDAKVINLSLGGPRDPDKPNDPVDPALNAALSTAAKSAVLVAAAGNLDSPDDQGVFYPASHPDVIAVGAVGKRDDELACYSAFPTATFPRALDVVAPGGAGYGFCPGTAFADDLLLLAPGAQYLMEAGTSFSAPLVSGVVALMRAANPGLSAPEARARLLGSLNKAGGLPVLDAEAAVRAATR